MQHHIKDKLSTYIDAIIGNTLYDILKFIFCLIIGTGFIGTLVNILIDFIKNPIIIKYRISISILLILLVVFFILKIYIKKFKRIPKSPAVESDYDVLKREITFTYGEKMSLYNLHVTIKSNKNGMNRFHGKYTWSGSDEPNIYCSNNHCTLRTLTRKDSFIEYEVELRKNYKKGKTTECTIIGEMGDCEKKFVPFFSTQITEITKVLIINICIPPEYNIREVIREEIAIVRNSNENSEIIPLDRDGKYTWIIDNPKLFYKYSIRWEL